MTEKNAKDLVADLKDADLETAQGILNDENARAEGPRVTVVEAAQARLELLDVPGEVQSSAPDGLWAQLLDSEGEPVLVEGQPVAADITPASESLERAEV